MGYVVAQLVEALRYKPEGRGFIGIFNHSGRTMTLGVGSAPNRNKYQRYRLGGKGAQG
jgi:hypothetical protein